MRVTNCVITHDGHVLLLQKPSRGWWSAPGGKMEQAESVIESVRREIYEETGIRIDEPELCGVFTFVIYKDETIVKEWTMFTFRTASFSGDMVEHSPEGVLSWIKEEDLRDIPMAPGDYPIIDHALHGEGVMYGTFTYDTDRTLLDLKLEASGTTIREGGAHYDRDKHN
ncbi:8-oxo-dGTP diphosphatase [Paenalkalicoccus suaedae]|uniref:8-oxo-dGTP diphosphatase n=1 Tax=Paenalkalicoccus suaedae TaxID=2592382 RepID=A0A859FHX8_9BACI|nr:8-oxo-dGTP diphosphatase [Paenalkalicoccus suaedae]QKS72252.1 8-oxo-dGTP diphosphatase [Paenalkalicoccus suaedae]